MSEHIRIGDIRPRVQYLGDGAVATFSFPFPIFAAEDLAVFRDATPCADGFAVAGAGQSGGGAVTFSSPPPQGCVVTLARAVPIARVTDFQDGGAFRATVINEELDRLVCMAQQLREELDRTLRRSATSTTVASLTLPEPAPGRALKFAADGALTVSASDPDTAQVEAAQHAATASAARVAAETALAQTLAAYDSFDDRYLGVKSVDPTTDNDGNPLFPGALYFQQVGPDAEGVMKVYTGAYWVAAYVNGSSILTPYNLLGILPFFDAAGQAQFRAGIDVPSSAETAAAVDALKNVAARVQSVAYTLALADRGGSVDTSAGVTVPANATVAFPIGSTVSITNTSASAITVIQAAGVTLRQAGTANTGNRTLAAYGMATLRKTAADTWFISGAGLS